MNIALWLERAGLGHGSSLPAIARGAQVVQDYRGLASRAARLAATLTHRFGLEPGERVAIVSRNSAEYLEVMYGIWHAGLVAVPINAKLHGAELGYILEHSGARLCFVSREVEGEITPYAPNDLGPLIVMGDTEYEALFMAEPTEVVARRPLDLAWLFYTSGTTGQPKGAMLTHRSLMATSLAYLSEVDPVQPGDPILHAAPLSHGSGLYNMAYVARLGTNVIPDSGGFDPDEVFRLIERWPRASMFAAPTLVNRLCECSGDCDPSRIRTIIWGGAPMYVEDAVRAIDRFGPCFAQIYGQGESPMTITTLWKQDIAAREHPRWSERLASAGRPFAGVEVLIADDEDHPLSTGEAGEILCRGDVVMSGYWQNPEASAATLRGGWLHTGDLGLFDTEGYLHLRGRSKDLIISGGTNIYPREVEEVLLRHPRVRETSVIGRPDREWGEIVVAYVVGGATAAELDALCLSRIARFKRPKEYVFVDALPKNAYGKVLKTEQRAADSRRAEAHD